MKSLCKLMGSITWWIHYIFSPHNTASTGDGSWVCFDCDKVWKTRCFGEKELVRLTEILNHRASSKEWYRNAIIRLINK